MHATQKQLWSFCTGCGTNVEDTFAVVLLAYMHEKQSDVLASLARGLPLYFQFLWQVPTRSYDSTEGTERKEQIQYQPLRLKVDRRFVESRHIYVCSYLSANMLTSGTVTTSVPHEQLLPKRNRRLNKVSEPPGKYLSRAYSMLLIH